MKEVLYIIAFAMQMFAWRGSGVPFIVCGLNLVFLLFLFCFIPYAMRGAKKEAFGISTTVAICIMLFIVNAVVFVSPFGLPVSVFPISEADEPNFEIFKPTMWKVGTGLISPALFACLHIAYGLLRAHKILRFRDSSTTTADAATPESEKRDDTQ